MNRTDSVSRQTRPASPPDQLRASRGLIQAGGGSMLACLLWALCGIIGSSPAQPPGTFPPADVVRPKTAAGESGKLPIEGILFLDETDVPIYVPPMSYEEYLSLEQGGKNLTKRHLFENIKIEGKVEGDRAELTVEVRIAVDATGDQPAEIPLAMKNFHLLARPEFFLGSQDGNQLAVTIDDETGDRVLVASIKENTIVGFRMQMSARVDNETDQSLDFHLPPSPVEINLLSDSRDVQAVIPNRDDEVVETATDNTGRSRFKIVSSGGDFTLQWGNIDRPVSAPLLDSNSTISIQWNSPLDQLIQNVQMTVRDARGPISTFQLRVPEGANLIDAPKLITSGQFGQLVELSKPAPDSPELYSVRVPVSEQEKTIALEFRLEIPSDSPSANQALEFQVPRVEGALRNRGTITITTSDDYRLRWRQRPYVKNVPPSASEEATVDQRTYAFQFIRGSFRLPLWLDATKSELRVTSECDIELRDNYANLAMEIRSTGNGNRAQLLTVDLADWQTPRIENARTGAPLPWYETDGLVEIEVSYTGMEESIPVLIKARRGLNLSLDSQKENHVDLPIPKVVGSQDQRDPITIQDAFVHISGKGRRSLVVDLERSLNLERASVDELPSADATANADRIASDGVDLLESTRIFTVMPPESSARVVGEIVLRSPRLNLQKQATVKLIGDQLVTTVDWTIQTTVDLEGRLQIAIPKSQFATDQPSVSQDDANRPKSDLENDSATVLSSPQIEESRWSVSVNDSAAQLQKVSQINGADQQTENTSSDPDPSTNDSESQSDGADYYDIISDALGDGVMRLRFVRSQKTAFDTDTSEAESILCLPYPVVQDITLEGNIEVELLGDETHDITPSEKSLTDQLVFRTIPTSPILLRVSPRTTSKTVLAAGQIVVRSAISEIAQHDQILTQMSGSGEFEVELRDPIRTEIKVELDGEDAAFKIIDRRLVIRIPPDAANHILDIRMWLDISNQPLFKTIQPLAHIGPNTGQLYWQLIVPPDSHLVWATASVGREMHWSFDRWKLIRTPLLGESALIGKIAPTRPETIALSPMPAGNQYLFSSMDDRSFEALAGSRTILWMLVAGSLVFFSALLSYIPATRSPFSLVIAIAAFSGLLAVAPDAAILVGQIAMFAMILVVVMLTVRSLVQPTPSRVLVNSRDSRSGISGNSRRKQLDYRPPSSIAVTHSIGPDDVSSTPDEVAS